MSGIVPLKNGNPYEYEMLLGTDTKTKEQIWLNPREYSLGGYFVGARRSGKSTLLENLITADIKMGRVGMMVIDPHADLIDKIINRMKQERIDKGNGDILLIDPKDYHYPFGLNIYHCEDKNNPLAVDYTVNHVLHLFQKLWPAETAQPLVEDVVRNSAYTIIANDLTIVEIPQLLFNRSFREKLLRNVTDSYILQFWEEYKALKPADQEAWAGPVGRRVRRFTSSAIIRNIVGQKKTLPMKHIIDTRKIVLVRLYSAMEELTTLIGSVLVGHILQAALSRSETQERPEFHLYCDEYAKFATADFATIISECGKYNVIPYIAHQTIGQIKEENQDSAIQLGNLFLFHLIGKDAEQAAGEFNTQPPKKELPEPTIPANLLHRLPEHQHEAVKAFWRAYVRRWLEAAGKQEKERVRTTTEWHVLGPETWEEKITTYPQFDLGEGVVSFEQRDIEEILFLVNDLLYETQVTGIVPTQKRIALIGKVAPFLGFSTFYRYSYSQTAYHSFELPLRAIRQRGEEDIAGLEAELAGKEKALASDDAFLSLHLQGKWSMRARKYAGIWKDEWYTEKEQVIYRISKIFQRDTIALGEINGSTKEALWISMQLAASENKRLVSFATYDQWIAARKDMLQQMLDGLQQERTQEAMKLAPYARVQEEYRRKERARRVPYVWMMKRCLSAGAFGGFAVWSFTTVLFGIFGVIALICAIYLLYSTVRSIIDGTALIFAGDSYALTEKYAHVSFLVQNTSWKREVTLCHSPLIEVPILWPPHGLFTWRFFGELTQAERASLDFSCCESVVELDEKIRDIRGHLGSDEKALAYPYSVDHPVALKKPFIQKLADACFLYSSYDTAERILALNKELYRVEVIKPLQDKVAQAKKKLASDLAALRTTLLAEKAPHDRFVTALDAVLSVLLTKEGKIKTYSTEWMDSPATQQTFSDKRNEIANELVHLPRGSAMIKTPHDEYVIETEPGKPIAAGFDKKKETIIRNTRERYCRDRSLVEEEIAERIGQGSQPQTSRKHTLEQSMR